MIRIQDCLKNIKINKISYLKDYIVITSSDHKYLIKPKDSNKKNVFDYLRSINYPYYVELENNPNDYYEIYPYYDDLVKDKSQKAKEMIYALISLHLKTINYKEYNTDKIKEIYETQNKIIDERIKYYLDLQDYIDELEYPLPEYYLLIKNISKIYKLLNISKLKIDSWYKNINNKIRESLLIKKTNLNNFRYGEKSYFIDLKDMKKGLIISDFVEFYKQEALNVDMKYLFSIYNSKIDLTNNELDILYSLISIPQKIEIKKSHYENTINVRKIIDYTEKTIEFISEEYKKNQETN